MKKAIIIIILAILIIVGIGYYASPLAEAPLPSEVDLSTSEVESQVDAIDLGEDIDASMKEIDVDLNTL